MAWPLLSPLETEACLTPEHAAGPASLWAPLPAVKGPPGSGSSNSSSSSSLLEEPPSSSSSPTAPRTGWVSSSRRWGRAPTTIFLQEPKQEQMFPHHTASPWGWEHFGVALKPLALCHIPQHHSLLALLSAAHSMPCPSRRFRILGFFLGGGRLRLSLVFEEPTEGLTWFGGVLLVACGLP